VATGNCCCVSAITAGPYDDSPWIALMMLAVLLAPLADGVPDVLVPLLLELPDVDVGDELPDDGVVVEELPELPDVGQLAEPLLIWWMFCACICPGVSPCACTCAPSWPSTTEIATVPLTPESFSGFRSAWNCCTLALPLEGVPEDGVGELLDDVGLPCWPKATPMIASAAMAVSPGMNHFFMFAPRGLSYLCHLLSSAFWSGSLLLARSFAHKRNSFTRRCPCPYP
jgi:hypothetical protein